MLSLIGRNNRKQVYSLMNILLAIAMIGISHSAFAERATSQIMSGVYDAISYLIPLSLREPELRSERDAALIKEKLNSLRSAAAALEKHTAGQEQEYYYLARSFNELTKRVDRSFANDWPEFAYYSLMHLVDHCVSCHSRLAATSQPIFAERLLARIDLKEIPPEDISQLYIATRQFDAAVKSLERHLLDKQFTPREADYSGLFVEYIRAAIVANKPVDDVIKFFELYRGRNDVPVYLDKRLAFWNKALQQLRGDLSAQPKFQRAKTIFTNAHGLSLAPGNHLRAVHDLVAASIIRELLALAAVTNESEIAECYYMLGIISLRTAPRKFGVPEMELLFSHAIEADPNGPFAIEAYTIIEEYGDSMQPTQSASDEQQTLLDMGALRRLIGIDE